MWMFRCLLFLAGLAVSTIVVGQDGNGLTNFQVLQFSNPARIAALGGNSIAIKDGDINLGIVAPSLLDSATAGQITLGFTPFFGEANIAHAGYAHQFNSLGTVAFSIQSLNYGSFTQTDETGAVTGSFNAGEYIFQAGLGRPIDENFSMGANVKFVLSEMAEYKASALAVDLAATFHKAEKYFTATLLAKNLGSSLKSYIPGTDEKLPFEIQLAMSKRLAKSPLRFQLVAENLQTWDLTPESSSEVEVDPISGEESLVNPGGFGENLMRHLVFNAEIILSKNLFLRVGYNYNRRQQLMVDQRPGGGGISFGGGLRVAKLHLSYARSQYSLAGVSNHFTLAVKFDDFRKAD